MPRVSSLMQLRTHAPALRKASQAAATSEAVLSYLAGVLQQPSFPAHARSLGEVALEFDWREVSIALRVWAVAAELIASGASEEDLLALSKSIKKRGCLRLCTLSCWFDCYTALKSAGTQSM